MATFGPTDLHVPYKNWSGEEQEYENYEEMERWSRRIKDCYPAASTGGSFTPLINCTVSHSQWYGTNIRCSSAMTVNFSTQMSATENTGPALSPTATGVKVSTNGLVTWEAQANFPFSGGLFGGMGMQVIAGNGYTDSVYSTQTERCNVVPAGLRMGGGYYMLANEILSINLNPFSVNDATNYVAQDVKLNLTHIHFTGVDDT